jgi:hypothetical protein
MTEFLTARKKFSLSIIPVYRYPSQLLKKIVRGFAMLKEADIERAAHHMIARHGNFAAHVAKRRVDLWECEGLSSAASIWRVITEKICALHPPPTEGLRVRPWSVITGKRH